MFSISIMIQKIKSKKDSVGYITNEEAIEFQQLCKQNLGRDLTLEEATDQGIRLIMIFEALQKFEPCTAVRHRSS